jgi:hypothetical protein
MLGAFGVATLTVFGIAAGIEALLRRLEERSFARSDPDGFMLYRARNRNRLLGGVRHPAAGESAPGTRSTTAAERRPMIRRSLPRKQASAAEPILPPPIDAGPILADARISARLAAHKKSPAAPVNE